MLQATKSSKISEFDVTERVKVTDPRCVQQEVKNILSARFPNKDLSIVDKAFDYFIDCYSGEHDDYHAVETPYHDIHHVMDVTLATVRLMDGHERQLQTLSPLGFDKVILGFIVALFHDSGYLRYSDDYEADHGAEHTPIHVSRSGSFIARFLNEQGMSDWVSVAQTLVQFTGIEQKIETLTFEDPAWLTIGYMIGTADLIAQMSDKHYAQKCHAHLFAEFSIAGMTQKEASDGSIEVIFANGDDLLKKTPAFIQDAIDNRLCKSFNKVFEYAAVYFGGRNLYMENIEKNKADIIKINANN
jgi:hypothetical protein